MRLGRWTMKRNWRHLAIGVALSVLVLPVSALAASANPAIVGSIANPGSLGGATSTAVAGSDAWVTSYAMGELTAVDISNPLAPVVAGSTPFNKALLNASTVNIANGDAYVVSKNRNASSTNNDDGTGNSFTIVNISNPAAPTIVGSLTDPLKLFGAYGVAVPGTHYAFVAAQGCLNGQPCPNTSVGNSFEVIDISTPSAPTIVATLHNTSLPAPWNGSNALDHADSVSIDGNDAYVTASYSNRLTVIDISNPLAPKIVASLKDPSINFPADVATSGNDAYVADQSGSTVPGFTVVDITNPAAPKVVGSVKNPLLNGAYRVRLSGNFAYVTASSAHAADVIDISSPTSPRFVYGLSDANHFWHTTGLDLSTGAANLIVTSPFLQTEKNVTYPPFPNQGGTTETGTLSDLGLIPNPISVQITAEPPLVAASGTANFTFSPSDTVSTPRCQIDGGPLGLCASGTTMSYTGLATGPHTFTVEAIDAAGNVSAPASYTWTVTSGGGGTTPAVTKISPTSGVKGGGTTVTITGTGFTGATAVDFGGTAAKSFTVASATRITAVSPAHAIGSVDVTVGGPGGTSAAVAADKYAYKG